MDVTRVCSFLHQVFLVTLPRHPELLDFFFFSPSKARPSPAWGLQTEVDLGLDKEIQ